MTKAVYPGVGAVQRHRLPADVPFLVVDLTHTLAATARKRP